MTLLEVLLLGPAYMLGAAMVLYALAPLEDLGWAWANHVRFTLAIVVPGVVIWLVSNGAILKQIEAL